MLSYVITEAGLEPVTVEEAKLFCRVDSTEEDSLFPILISAARQQAEHRIGRLLRNSKYNVMCEDENGSFEIPLLPCTALYGVTVDGDDIDQSLYDFVASKMIAKGEIIPAKVILRDNFPYDKQSIFSVQAGYTVVDKAIKSWILIKVNTLYEQRETFAIGQNYNTLEHSFVDGLLDAHITHGGF